MSVLLIKLFHQVSELYGPGCLVGFRRNNTLGHAFTARPVNVISFPGEICTHVFRTRASGNEKDTKRARGNGTNIVSVTFPCPVVEKIVWNFVTHEIADSSICKSQTSFRDMKETSRERFLVLCIDRGQNWHSAPPL